MRISPDCRSPGRNTRTPRNLDTAASNAHALQAAGSALACGQAISATISGNALGYLTWAGPFTGESAAQLPSVRRFVLAETTKERVGPRPERMMETYMTTVPFKRHPARPILDLVLWMVFMITAILALFMVLGIVG